MQIQPVELVVVIVLGLLLGSFATALSWRIPRKIPWTFGGKSDEPARAARSCCPSCQKTLSIVDLVPVFSWLALAGKCRYCKEAIGWRYILTELGVLAGCLGVYFSWGLTVEAFMLMAAVPFLAALFIIDLRHLILPNQLVALLAVLGACFAVWKSVEAGDLADLSYRIVSGLAFGVIIWCLARVLSWVLKKETLGFGDVKFFAMAGLWLGFTYLPLFFFLSGIFGTIWGLVTRVTRAEPLFPFGPALILSFYACMVLQGLGVTSIFELYWKISS